MSTPSGNVNVNKGGISLGAITLDDSGNGSLSYTATASDIGETTLAASYPGDSTHNPSSGTCTEEIDSQVQNTTTTLTSSPNPAIVGQVVVVSASVQNA